MQEHHDHVSHHEMMARDFKKRFVVSGSLTIPILILSPTIQGWLGFTVPDFPGRAWLLLALASVVALWGSWPFYANALGELKERRLGMMVLVSIAVGTGYLYSVATTFFIDAPDFYWEISTLAVFLLFGHWMEMRSVVGASGALKELVKLIPPKAVRLRDDGSTEEVSTEDLQKGDMVLVRPGEQVPVDGEVVEGESHVNEAMLTGESKPVAKTPGDEAVGGTLNVDGALKVRITRTGEETALAQIIELVRQAQASKPKTQKLADTAAHYLTITAIIVGGGSLVLWSTVFGAEFVFALTLAITVIVITCPHALGLAIPIVTTVTTSLAAKNGMLVRDMKGLEAARNVNIVVFDKTGTLTEGRFGVTDIVAPNGNEEDVLATTASLERNSEHVIAKGIVVSAEKRGITFKEASEFRNRPGRGISGVVDGKRVLAGNRALMEEEGVDISALGDRPATLAGEGKTVIYLAENGAVKGALALADVIREESREAVRKLKDMGIEIAMLTGDSETVAAHVAGELELDIWFADVLPEDKSEKIASLQEEGKTVMMVGDGVNDAPALTRSDVGVAIGAGTDVAVAAAEIVLVKNDPRDIVKLISLSRKTWTKMKQNLGWAVGYNVIAIPVAAGVLAPWGIFLRPEWGALAMSASSVIVVINALRLRKADLGAQ